MTNTETFQIDSDLVHSLVAEQFPEFAGLAIIPVSSSGWDNRTFHLGTQMSVRLPSGSSYSAQVEKEQIWLPKLAPYLPLPIPHPIALGRPCPRYPWPWSIYRWIDGETAAPERIDDLVQFAADLANFLLALQQIDTTDGPAAGSHNFYRGGPLAEYNDETMQAIKVLNSQIKSSAVFDIWENALASSWDRAPVWVHGDVAVGNILVKNGKLSAIIDFGCLAVGDPACDLVMAWTFFKGQSRKVFRNTLKIDDATWARARGWALWKALFVCAKLPGANLADIEKSHGVVRELLKEYEDAK